MPIVVRNDLKMLERDLAQQVSSLIGLLHTRDLHDPTEGCKPGHAWTDPKSLGVTRGTDTDIQLAADKVKAVVGLIRRTKSPTLAKLTEPSTDPEPETKPAFDPVTRNPFV